MARKGKNERSNIFYAVIGIAVLLATVAVLALLQQPNNPYQSLPNYATADCGDINDPANVQHLSHHPQTYADCIKQVNPQKFLEATGQQLADYMKMNGIA